MNKIATLAAISMFAVILGLGAFGPAMAVPGNEKSKATASVCHWDEVEDDILTVDVDESLESAWIVLYLNGNGQINGHVDGDEHDDEVIESDTLPSEITAEECLAKNDL